MVWLMDPADFYTGIVAELYGPLKSHSFDPAPYAAFIQRHGQPALELGCGDGEPMLDLLRAGYDVDGVDSSADMLDRFRHRADTHGLAPHLYCQRMEQLDLPRRYRSIFLAGPTINLLGDDDSTSAALRSIGEHLLPGGRALVPLFVPEHLDSQAVGVPKEKRADDGTILRVAVESYERDADARTQKTRLRYERHSGHGTVVESRDWLIHWHTPQGFEALVNGAGLSVVGAEGDHDSGAIPGSEWTFTLARADDEQ